MRVRYIQTDDLDVLEGTVNLLLSQGWERDAGVMFTSGSGYFQAMVNYDRPRRGSARAEDIPRTAVERRPYNTDGTYASLPTDPGPGQSEEPEQVRIDLSTDPMVNHPTTRR